jgi:hypothetical protein
MDLQWSIVQWYHDAPMAGHPGELVTFVAVAMDYWWPGMRTFVCQYVAGCAPCQQFKINQRLTKPTLVLIPSSSFWPFTQCSMDFITDLPEINGFNAILSVVDHGLTKEAIFIPCSKSIDSEQTPQLLVNRLFSRFGLSDSFQIEDHNLHLEPLKNTFDFLKLNPTSPLPFTHKLMELLNDIIKKLKPISWFTVSITQQNGSNISQFLNTPIITNDTLIDNNRLLNSCPVPPKLFPYLRQNWISSSRQSITILGTSQTRSPYSTRNRLIMHAWKDQWNCWSLQTWTKGVVRCTKPEIGIQ